MAWLVQPIPASPPSELPRFLRQKAEECLRLARAMAEESAAAKELIVMAASLHDRALKLEALTLASPQAEQAGQANDQAQALAGDGRSGAET